jgi:hypothetical protein
MAARYTLVGFRACRVCASTRKSCLQSQAASTPLLCAKRHATKAYCAEAVLLVSVMCEIIAQPHSELWNACGWLPPKAAPPPVSQGQHFSASSSCMPSPARKVSSGFIKGTTTSTASCQTFQNYQSQYHEPQALSAQIQSNHIYPITTSLGVWCWGPEVFLSNSTTTPHRHRWRRRPSSSSL